MKEPGDFVQVRGFHRWRNGVALGWRPLEKAAGKVGELARTSEGEVQQPEKGGGDIEHSTGERATGDGQFIGRLAASEVESVRSEIPAETGTAGGADIGGVEAGLNGSQQSNLAGARGRFIGAFVPEDSFGGEEESEDFARQPVGVGDPVGGEATTEIGCLADVEDALAGVTEVIDAGAVGDGTEEVGAETIDERAGRWKELELGTGHVSFGF